MRRRRATAQPFSTNVAVFPSPWSEGRKLVRIGIKGYAVQRATRPRANLVFLIDTSGSMNAPNKLPLVQRSLNMLLDELDERDTVAIVTYAGNAGTALEPTPVRQKEQDPRGHRPARARAAARPAPRASGRPMTLAKANYDPKGVNRVILATDGDFNVGITDQGELKGFVERERGKGVFLSVLGFGMGNYNDALMQTLAQNGNGTAAYIDTARGGPQDAGRGGELDPVPDRQGREDPGRVQSRRPSPNIGSSATRPARSTATTSTMTRSMPATSARARR